MRVVLAGATGLVGKAILNRLATMNDIFSEITALIRRPVSDDFGGKVIFRRTDFSEMDDLKDLFPADVLISSLGTTLAKAGNRKNFREVDFGINFRLASLAGTRGLRHFIIVSAIGADHRSPLFYYRVKGELENALAGLGFESLTIVRPSLLLGNREEKRPMEKLGQVAGKLIGPILPRIIRPVYAEDVGAVVAAAAAGPAAGKRIITSRDIVDFRKKH